ncbi:MAG: aminotransferase class IV [Dehalococcoidia bacterium]
MSTPLAWLDGALVPRADARVSIDDFAVRSGATCFETMLAEGGRVFRLDRHLARLRGGLLEMGVSPPHAADLGAAIDETLRANGLTGAQVRLTVTAGRGGSPDLAAAAVPSVFVTTDPANMTTPQPLRLRVVSVRIDERRPLRAAKVAQFLPYLLARAEARAAGADDGLLLNHAGTVCEAATANVFAVIDGRLATPARDDGPVPGVTRDAVLECAAVLGIDADERTIPLVELGPASEMFVTTSLAGPRAVTAVAAVDAEDGRSWRAPAAPGPLTTRLAEAYAALVARECAAPSV